jgi:hypothetical protein
MADSFYHQLGVRSFFVLKQVRGAMAWKGGENMDRPQSQESTAPDEEMLQVWEDMRTEVLHELQDGGEVPDALVDIIGYLATMLDSWRVALKSSTLQPSRV